MKDIFNSYIPHESIHLDSLQLLDWLDLAIEELCDCG